MIDQILESSGASVNGKGAKGAKGAKKVSDRKGKPTCNGDWIKKIRAEHAEELKAFQESSEKKQGAHMIFVNNYRRDHPDEYEAFAAEWKDTNSMSQSNASDADSVADVEEAPIAKPAAKPSKSVATSVPASVATPVPASVATPVPVPVTTPSKPVAAPVAPNAPAKKPVKKAQKAIVTPIAAPLALNSLEELLPFTMSGVTYLRMGSQRPDGNHLWSNGHLWVSEKGAKGDHYGELQDDGTIDTTVEEPSS